MTQAESKPPEVALGWEREARRVATAFGIEVALQPLGALFTVKRYRNRQHEFKETVFRSAHALVLVAQSQGKWEASRFYADIVHGNIYEQPDGMTFRTKMAFDWAAGLFKIGRMESFEYVCKNFNFTITAHERMEWLLEMKRAGFEVPT